MGKIKTPQPVKTIQPTKALQPVNLEKYTGIYTVDAASGPVARLSIKDGKLVAEYEGDVITLIHTEGHKFRMDGGPLHNGILEFIPNSEGAFSSFDAEGYVLTKIKE